MLAGTLRVPATPAWCVVHGVQGGTKKLRCTGWCLWARATEMRACAGVLVRRSCTSMGTGVELRSTLAKVKRLTKRGAQLPPLHPCRLNEGGAQLPPRNDRNDKA